MLCRRCMVVMEPGTTYENKKDKSEERMEHKRFNQCPKCKERIYNKSPNFQEIFEEIPKRR